jgi:transcriptional regulator with XRE-family HTH domain
MKWTPARIKSLRTRLDYTQEQMADALGYGSYQRVSELENDKRKPSAPVERLLDMLDRQAEVKEDE